MTLQPGRAIVIAGLVTGAATHTRFAFGNRPIRHAGDAVQDWLVTLNEPAAFLPDLAAFLANGVAGGTSVCIGPAVNKNGTMARIPDVGTTAFASTESRQQKQDDDGCAHTS